MLFSMPCVSTISLLVFTISLLTTRTYEPTAIKIAAHAAAAAAGGTIIKPIIRGSEPDSSYPVFHSIASKFHLVSPFGYSNDEFK